MPTYQYACTACDHRFDAVQSFTDSSLTECPACAGVLRKIFSSVGVVFKGSGFYRNDSRTGGDGASSESAKSEGKSESGSGESAKSEGKSESGSNGSGSSETGSSNGASKESSSSGTSGNSSSTSSTPATTAS